MSGTLQDGTRWEWPSIKEIDGRMLDYWVDRAKQAKHPIMRSRYAGLVWEFNPIIQGKSAGIEIARTFIDAVIDIATNGLHEHETDIWRQLTHAVSVSISINDEVRIAQVRDTVLAYEARVGTDDSPGLWGNAFDLLYDNKKSLLTDVQRTAVIQNLEDRLERISNPEIPEGSIDPWAAEAAAQRLAKHFQRQNQKEEVRRVLLKVERAFNHLIDAGAAAMVSQAWLEQVEREYRHFGLNEDASRMRRRIHDLGPAARNQLIKAEHKFEIKKDELDGYVDAILEGGVESALQRFVVHHIPRREQTVAQLMEMREKAGLLFWMNQQKVDDNGRPLATIGSLDDDLDGHVISQTTQSMGVTGIFLRRVIEGMIDRYQVDTKTILGRLNDSPIFDPSRHELLQRGLDAYFAGNSVLSLHLLVPQVEAGIRNLLLAGGGDVYKPNKFGGMDVRGFGDMLSDNILDRVLTSDVVEYFKILYTDIRGFNLRNDLCHGLLAVERFGLGLADRVFHSLVLLSMIRKADPKPASDGLAQEPTETQG